MNLTIFLFNKHIILLGNGLNLPCCWYLNSRFNNIRYCSTQRFWWYGCIEFCWFKYIRCYCRVSHLLNVISSQDKSFQTNFLHIYSLPVPWLIYGIIYGEPVEVSSEGMVCSITILFLMLLFVIISIACFRWKMNKGLGLVMFVLYFVFVAVSLAFEYEWYVCPL